MNVPKDLVAASSIPMVLLILNQGESYGYEIIKRVREASHQQLSWTDGMLYPVLHRLEQQKLVESIWRTASSGRKRKYYRITPKGRTELELRQQHWAIVRDALDRLDAGKGDE